MASVKFAMACTFSSLPTVAKVLMPNALHSMSAVVPMPLVPPCINTTSPALALPIWNTLAQTVKKVSGIAAASTKLTFSGICKV